MKTSSNEDLAGARRHGDGSVNELQFIGPVANDHFTDNKHLGLLGIIYNNIYCNLKALWIKA